MCDVQSAQYLGNREVGVVHALEYVFVECIQRDGDTLEAGIFQRLCLFCQQRTVGGQGQVELLAIRRFQGAQHGDQRFDVLAQQRLAAGQADFVDAMGDEQTCQPGNFFKRQQCSVWQECIVLVEHCAWHAVDAAEVAAVGDRDAQVV